MGALSVVISAILSSWFLQEKLSLFGWLGCSLCIVSITVIPELCNRVHVMHVDRICCHSPEWTIRAVHWADRAVPTYVPRARLPRMDQCADSVGAGDHILLRAKVRSLSFIC